MVNGALRPCGDEKSCLRQVVRNSNAKRAVIYEVSS